MVLPGNTAYLVGVLDMYAILKFSQKRDNRDLLNCWSSNVIFSFASIPYAPNTTLFFTAMAIHISVLPSHSFFLPVMNCNYFPSLSALTNRLLFPQTSPTLPMLPKG